LGSASGRLRRRFSGGWARLISVFVFSVSREFPAVFWVVGESGVLRLRPGDAAVGLLAADDAGEEPFEQAPITTVERKILKRTKFLIALRTTWKSDPPERLPIQNRSH